MRKQIGRVISSLLIISLIVLPVTVKAETMTYGQVLDDLSKAQAELDKNNSAINNKRNQKSQDNATITYTFAGSTKVYYEYSVRITIATHTPTPTVKITIVTHTPTPTVKISIATQTPTPSAGTAVQAPTYYGGTWHESDENYWAPYVSDINK